MTLAGIRGPVPVIDPQSIQMILAKEALKRLGLGQRQQQPCRRLRLLAPLMMGRRSAKIAGKKVNTACFHPTQTYS